MKNTLLELLHDDRGGPVVEYAIVAAAIALPIIAIGVLIATECGTALTTQGTNLESLGLNP